MKPFLLKAAFQLEWISFPDEKSWKHCSVDLCSRRSKWWQNFADALLKRIGKSKSKIVQN